MSAEAQQAVTVCEEAAPVAATAEAAVSTSTTSSSEETTSATTTAESPANSEAAVATPTKPPTTLSAADETPQPKPQRRVSTPASAVGKSGAKNATPAKRTPAAKMPSAAKVAAGSSKKTRNFDVIHAKQLAKEPTLHEHDKAKKAKADELLNSATRATRSASRSAATATVSTPAKKKIAFAAKRAHVSVLDRPTISSSLKAEETKKAAIQRAAQPKPRAPASTKKPAAAAARSASAKDAKAKQPLGYKPYTGPLPKYTEDPIFSPVDKAKLAARDAQTPAKKGKGKENGKPLAMTPRTKAAPAAASAAKKPATSTAKRTPIKKATSSSAATAKAKEERRAKFAQTSKARAAGARQSPRRAAAEKAT